MVGLILASIWVWMIHRLLLLADRASSTRRSRDYEGEFWGERDTAKGLSRQGAAQGNPGGPRGWRRAGRMEEIHRQAAGRPRSHPPAHRRQRWKARVAEEADELAGRLNFLAHGRIGRRRLVGLFGTVWGIMNSFSPDRRAAERQPRRGSPPGHRRGAVCHGHRTWFAAIPSAVIAYNRFFRPR